MAVGVRLGVLSVLFNVGRNICGVLALGATVPIHAALTDIMTTQIEIMERLFIWKDYDTDHFRYS